METQNKALQKYIGSLMAIFGLAILVWLLIGAETTGSGLQLGVNTIGVILPVSVLIIAGLGLFVFGLVIAYGTSNSE